MRLLVKMVVKGISGYNELKVFCNYWNLLLPATDHALTSYSESDIDATNGDA